MTIGCPDCGELLAEPAHPRQGATLSCSVCRSELERTTGRSLNAALACASATFLLLFPANLLPFLTTSVFGVSRQSRLATSATAMWRDGWPALSLVIFAFVVLLPFVRFGLLTAVLGMLRLGRRPAWLGPMFRRANDLQTWAMPDVFLLGLWVAFERLSATIPTFVGVGAECFIAAGVLALLTRATLDKAAIWRLISPDDAAPLACAGGGEIICQACELVLPAAAQGAKCPRCRCTVRPRKRNAVMRAGALTLAGLLLYIPANLYPIATLPIGLKPTQYTVLEGVKDLAQAGLFGLAGLVFTASFAIPFLKLAGMTVCIAAVLRPSRRHLVFKTRLYRVIEEIGRWSMVDPFVIACFVPVTQYNSLLTGHANTAAPFFTGVVVLTMIAADRFDPRLMWDAARRRA